MSVLTSFRDVTQTHTFQRESLLLAHLKLIRMKNNHYLLNVGLFRLISGNLSQILTLKINRLFLNINMNSTSSEFLVLIQIINFKFQGTGWSKSLVTTT